MHSNVAAAALLTTLSACGGGVETAALEVWHGGTQRVGHLGDAQDDFNLMGYASANALELSINGGPAMELTLADETFGFRRLGDVGHFNADIPLDSLRAGDNELELVARGSKGSVTARVTLRKEYDELPLPFEVRWSEVTDPQDVGQYVDGEWQLEGTGAAAGLSNERALYDRLFLLGNRTWTDYDVTTTIRVNDVAAKTGPHSGAPGVGLILRFAGHSVDPPRFPDVQPKWGFQPFGAILWLRWTEGPDALPALQFYRGDRNESQGVSWGAASLGAVTTRSAIRVRARCATDPDDSRTTTYRFKAWPVADASGAPVEEPSDWAFKIQQVSETALRAGGVALVAHHVDATFGDVSVRPLGNPAKDR